jgi:hypothetical protein
MDIFQGVDFNSLDTTRNDCARGKKVQQIAVLAKH